MSRRWLITFTALAAGAGPLAAQRERIVIVIPGQMERVVSDTSGTPFAFDYPPARVFRALVGVYQELKIPITLRDSVVGEIGNLKFHKTASLGGVQLSTYLSCGSGATGPHADTYRVYMAARSVVVPNADGTIMRSTLFAAAQNIAEGARQAMPCESNGRLEFLIAKMVQRRLDSFF